MKFKPIRYNQGEGIAKIKIEDDTGRTLENWTVMMSNLTTWFKLMQKKYGDQINSKEDKNKPDDRDLDWLK